MEEYFYKFFTITDHNMDTSNKLICAIKKKKNCDLYLYSAYKLSYMVFLHQWGQRITVEWSTCNQVTDFYFINLCLWNNCSLLTMTSRGHCSKIERSSWIQCICTSIPVVFLEVKNWGIDWGKGPFIVKLKHYISNWKVKTLIVLIKTEVKYWWCTCHLKYSKCSTARSTQANLLLEAKSWILFKLYSDTTLKTMNASNKNGNLGKNWEEITIL